MVSEKASPGTWRVSSENQTKSVFSEVVFMRPPKVRIYQVTLDALNRHSLFSYFGTFFASGAMALWTGQFTSWHNTGVLVSAAIASAAAIACLVVSVITHIRMTRECEEVPYRPS
jgi:hypothetical protein